jgi:hypothetical protein
MKKILLTVSFSLLSILFFPNTYAASQPSAYKDCGIGAGIFENDTAAIISNVIWDLGSTAITSATASPDTCEGFNVDVASFINNSYDRLVEETAAGQGTHLDTLLSIAKLSEDRKSEVVQAIRVSMAKIVASEPYLAADEVEKASFYYYSLMDAIKA